MDDERFAAVPLTAADIAEVLEALDYRSLVLFNWRLKQFSKVGRKRRRDRELAVARSLDRMRCISSQLKERYRSVTGEDWKE